MLKIGTACGSGLGSSFMVQMNRLVRNLVHFIIDDGTN